MPPSANPAELSEAQFLQQQAELAREAISRTFSHFTSGLGKGANPMEWTKEYPWATLGAAAVAGFVAANMLVPSKEDQALRKLAALERALHPPPPVVEGSTTEKDPAKHGVVYGLVNQMLKAVQPAVISAITAHIAKNDPPQNGNAANQPPPGH